jgi:amino acid adenylation domain-containing protein
MTYRALVEAARRVARGIADAPGSPGEPVALLFDHDTPVIVAILGSLLAGRPYVALDPAVPASRHRDVLADLGPATIVTQRRHLPAAADFGDRHSGVVQYEALLECEPLDEPLDQGPDSAAGIFYTSGTTGHPKGVVWTHRLILHRIMLDSVPGGFGSDDVFSLLYSCSFGTSVNDIFGALLNGGSAVLWDVTGAGAGALADWLDQEGVTVLHAQASLLRKILELMEPTRTYPRLRMVIPSGRIYRSDLARLFEHLPDDAVVVSRYASTEALLVSRLYIDRDSQFEDGAIPVGKPVGDKQVVVVDPKGTPVATGQAGEIVVSSGFLSPGYWKAPQDSASPFEPDPERTGYRRFRTGDYGRIQGDGNLEFVGRVDDRVKVRGYRIELEEVVTALHALPGVKDAAITVVQHAGSDHLAAYLVTSGERPPGVSELREELGKVLAPYMIPSFFVPLEAMPLKGNGKIDTEALPSIGGTRPLLDEKVVAPRTETEAVIGQIWEDVLGISPIGVNDRFLDLGGDSLSAIKVIGRVLATFGVDQSVRSLMDAGTVAAMARTVTERGPSAVERSQPIERRADGASIPATYGQTALWLAEQLGERSGAYNMPKVVALEGPLDVSLLREALTCVVQRQSALRATFDLEDARLIQRLHPVEEIRIDQLDVNGRSVSAAVEAFSSQPFDLAAGLPFRVGLVRLSETKHTLVFVNHHIVGDRVSSRVLLSEVAASYRAFVRGERPVLPDLPVEFADFAIWQRQVLSHSELQRQVAFWVDRLATKTGSLSPIVTEGAVGSTSTRQVGFRCGPERLAVLDERAVEHGASRFMMLLALVALTLSKATSRSELVVGITVTGRARPELEGLVGYFVNLLALPLSMGAQAALSDAIAECRGVLLDAFAHSEAPFDHVVAELDPPRVPGRMPIVDVMVNYDDAGSDDLDFGPVRGRRVRLNAMRTRNPLSITFRELEGELQCDLVYDTALVEGGRADALLGELQRLLTVL